MNAITIDGPAASGKSTVGYEAAQQLDFLFFDTGIMYRAVTWAILERGLNADDRRGALDELPSNFQSKSARRAASSRMGVR